MCVHACGNPHMYLLRSKIVIMTSSSVISMLQLRRLPLTEPGAPCFDYILCSVTLRLPVSCSEDWVYRHILPGLSCRCWDLNSTLMIVQQVFSTLCHLPKPAPYFFKNSLSLHTNPCSLSLPTFHSPSLYPTLSPIHLREGESSLGESAKFVIVCHIT